MTAATETATPAAPGCPCMWCRMPAEESLLSAAQRANHAFEVHLGALDVVGDWQGPVLDTTAARQSVDRYGQWLARHGGHREKWAFHAAVCRLTAETYAEQDADPVHVERARRQAEVYTAAAVYAPASVWVVIAGDHNAWDDPEEHEDGEEWVAGPFPSEAAAAEHCETHDLGDDVSIVARHPGSA